MIGKLTMLASIGVPAGHVHLSGALSRLPIGWLLLIDFALLGSGFRLDGPRGGSRQPMPGAPSSIKSAAALCLPTMLVWATRGLAYAIRGRGIGMWQAAFAIGQFLSGMAVTLLEQAARRVCCPR